MILEDFSQKQFCLTSNAVTQIFFMNPPQVICNSNTKLIATAKPCFLLQQNFEVHLKVCPKSILAIKQLGFQHHITFHIFQIPSVLLSPNMFIFKRVFSTKMFFPLYIFCQIRLRMRFSKDKQRTE